MGYTRSSMPPDIQASPSVSPVTPPPVATPRDLRPVALLLGAVAVALVLYLSATRLPGAGDGAEPFPLYEGGSLAFFTIERGAIVQTQAPVAFPKATFKTRFVASTLPSGDTPVLVDSDGIYAAALGVVRSDGTFITLVNDKAPKLGVTAHGDMIVYAVYREAMSSNGTAMGEWRLMRASAYDAVAPQTLGAGFGPVFASNGAIIALAPEGLVYLDPVSGTRDVLIDRHGVSYGIGAVSTDATVAVLPNGVTHALDVFRLSSSNPRLVAYVSSIPGDADAVTFTGPEVFSVKMGNALTVYAVENDAIVTKGSYTFAP